MFGESHGEAVGVALERVPCGLKIDFGEIKKDMQRRAPGRDPISTARSEPDIPEIISGVLGGVTTGAPLCALIRNTNVKSADYESTLRVPRPGHAEMSAHMRYGRYFDPRGGGHFSGRLTAPLVFAGALAKQIIAQKGVFVGAHILEAAGVRDEALDPCLAEKEALRLVAEKSLPVILDSAGSAMREAILAAKKDGDSVGGVIECAILGAPGGLGSPGFECAEAVISRYLFAVPAVKGVQFGAGFSFAGMRGSEANDPIRAGEDDELFTASNHNGGILGGITNGMPIIFSVAVKPTPSISSEQDSVNLDTMQNQKISVIGRHDPCIVQRAVVAVEAAAALAVSELLDGGAPLWAEI